MSTPAVSVVLPAYNAEPTVAAAVESVLAQTFDDFELLAVDDGSTDGTAAVLRSFEDRRLTAITRPHEGVVATMNAALALARAPLIARADADDICVAERLQRQVAFLAGHADIAVVGGAMRTGARVLTYPSDALRIRWTALYRSPFANTTIMFRRDAARAVGGYPSDHHFVDDYPFVSRLVARWPGANLADVLVVQRPNPDGISGRHGAAQVAEGDRVRRANAAALLGEGPDAEALVALLVGRVALPAPARVAGLLDAALEAFRRRWTVDAEQWKTLAPWIGRELFERALGHERHPAVLARMVAYACRLDPALPLRPRFARGLVTHLILSRAR